jgi:hypothetical protein
MHPPLPNETGLAQSLGREPVWIAESEPGEEREPFGSMQREICGVFEKGSHPALQDLAAIKSASLRTHAAEEITSRFDLPFHRASIYW